ncbi:hypothetical protein ACFP47_03540 [Nesterenkonia lacusekhoensis]|uniref:Fis family transcriptional regulator n=1 Tax=Nesterenkonia lacusekhoensis TaxID=150832 RepID=A0ABS4T2F8_9MICC|nr:hypothetical protein [Nesterenkonia lacusekhoensis]MBP2318633.1 hypothetical protein [Nesterenkonia lacusekhoensis]
MRWESLFDDMETSFAAASEAELESEIAEAVRLERSALRFTDRLRASRGSEVHLVVAGGRRVSLTVGAVGEDWLSGAEGPREVLIPAGAVRSAVGLARRAETERSHARRRLGITAPLRQLLRDRAQVVVFGAEGILAEGLLLEVGRDVMEVLPAPPGEIPRRRAAQGAVAVPLAAVVMVSGA